VTRSEPESWANHRRDLRDEAADAREHDLDVREEKADRREHDADEREKKADQRELLQDMRDREYPAASSHLDVLTNRECDVLALVADGLTNQAIAARLCLSINTVKSNIRYAYRKAGVSSRTQAVLWYEHGDPSDEIR
jgi:DNA-binding NarL/FixJ family response regulator